MGKKASARNKEAANQRASATNVIQQQKAAEKRRNLITFGVIGLVVVAMIGGVVWSIQSNKVDKNTAVVAPSNVTDKYGILHTADEAGGEATGGEKPQVVIYEDFSCPSCKQFEELAGSSLDKLVADGEAEIEYRIVGFLDDMGVANQHSKRSASAAFCVREEEGMEGWKEYHDWLYQEQPQEGNPGPTNAEFIEGAKELGLSVDESCVKSEKYLPWLEEATDEFAADKIGGTPTVLVNGEQVEASFATIEAALAAAK